jgi:CARDB
MKIKLKTIVICCMLLAFTQWNCQKKCEDGGGVLPDLRYLSCTVTLDSLISNKFNVKTVIKNDVSRPQDCGTYSTSIATTQCISITYKNSAGDTTWLPAQLLTLDIPLLQAGDEYTRQFSFTATFSGIYRFCFAIDCKNSVVESKEDNNSNCN